MDKIIDHIELLARISKGF